MGSVNLKIGDGTARFRRSTLCSSLLHLLMLSSVLTTNLFALYAFTSSPPSSASSFSNPNSNLSSVLTQHISSILREIELSESKLHQIERDLAGYSTLDPTSSKLPSELKLFLSRHLLPLGKDSKSGITEMVSSVAHSCTKSPDILAQFMNYKPFYPCPSADSHWPQKLISRGCEPLPRRRCLSRPKSRSNHNRVGVKIQSWVKPRGKNDFLVDDVLALGGGGIRIGFDLGSSATGEFAAVLADRNVTIMSSSHLSENVESVTDKGMFPLMMSSAMRFPFYDGVFDLVHTMQGLDEGGAEGMGMGRAEAMEFLMFDIDRVLRAGGLFWLDNYLCVDDEKKRTVMRLIERFGYKKLKWVVGEKADPSGKGKSQVYLSAVLQKPARG